MLRTKTSNITQGSSKRARNKWSTAKRRSSFWAIKPFFKRDAGATVITLSGNWTSFDLQN
jgi:hypothetical protein